MITISTKRFISFEGIDFSGKTTQIKLLKEFLEEKGFQAEVIREPGGTAISEKIRQVLLDRENHRMSELCEIFLYSAARTQLVSEKIIPLLEKNYFVLADRYVDSTTAYQGYGRGIELEIVQQINRAATLGVMPGVTFYLQIEPEVLEHRLKKSGRAADRLETAGIEFFRRVNNGYNKIASNNPERIHVLNAADPAEIIQQEIQKTVADKKLLE